MPRGERWSLTVRARLASHWLALPCVLVSDRTTPSAQLKSVWPRRCCCAAARVETGRSRRVSECDSRMWPLRIPCFTDCRACESICVQSRGVYSYGPFAQVISYNGLQGIGRIAQRHSLAFRRLETLKDPGRLSLPIAVVSCHAPTFVVSRLWFVQLCLLIYSACRDRAQPLSLRRPRQKKKGLARQNLISAETIDWQSIGKGQGCSEEVSRSARQSIAEGSFSIVVS